MTLLPDVPSAMTFHLIPQPIRRSSAEQIRSCRVQITGGHRDSTDRELWFSYPPDVAMPDDADADAYLLASLLPAMKEGADIRVAGSVSRELLANLTELILVWAKWCPSIYSRVNISVDCVRDHDARLTGAIAAFSGGADAQFTAYRHSNGTAGHATQDLKAGVFVHGFDIPLSDEDGFRRAALDAELVLGDIGLDMHIVRTNLQHLSDVNWEHYCGTAIASVLVGLKGVAGVGLIGSGEPYDALVVPWGSSPICDPLCSTGGMQIRHDGAGFNRSEKIRVLAGWETGVKHLRVCWAGDDHSRNCGRCEKCVRTQLNFMLAGLSRPACFPSPLAAGHLSRITLTSEAQAEEWSLIQSEIVATGTGREWLPHIDNVLRRKAGPRLARLLPVGSRRRAWVKQLSMRRP